MSAHCYFLPEISRLKGDSLLKFTSMLWSKRDLWSVLPHGRIGVVLSTLRSQGNVLWNVKMPLQEEDLTMVAFGIQGYALAPVWH